MTGEQNRTRSPWPPHQKKSYNIADILKDKDGEGREENPGTSAPAPAINPYPPLFLNPIFPLLSRKASPEPVSNQALPEEELRFRISREGYNQHVKYDFPPSHGVEGPSEYSPHPQGTFPLAGIPRSEAPTLFQSPNYISLLLANPFVQPYVHHNQRIQDIYGYNGRSFTMGSKRKGGQVRFAAAQTARLEKEFTDHKYLHANDRKRLAQALKLTDRQVKTWFQNRRAKWRKVSVSKGHSRPESHVSASFVMSQDEKDCGYSPDQGRCASVSSLTSENST